DHIESLGADAIWLNPCYPSPQKDHGYDVSDYFDIHDEYGDLATFDALVADAQERGIKILMDVVPNHCSSQHRWFLDALAAAPGSPERARFYFRDGKGPHGSEPPNNWQAAFGGSAWTRATADSDLNDTQWYLGTFTPHQPDFDHTNADVQAMFADVLRFWFDRGVEGFRVDAITPVGKDPALPDQPPVGPEVGVLDITWANPYTVFREEGHVVWRQWRTVIDDYAAAHPERDLMMVAEAYATRRPELVRAFTRADEFHQMFAFDLMLSPWHKESLERALDDILGLAAETHVAPAWTLNNHDTQRIVTRLGRPEAEDPDSWTGNNLSQTGNDVDLELGTRRARALTALAFAVPGSLYLYQGEELGLPEVFDIPDDRREDPVFHLTHGAGIGRDGCRIPLPWTADPATSFGFSTPNDAGVVDGPWLPQPSTWGRHAASSQQHAGSMLDLYRHLSAARRRHAVTNGLAADVVDLGEGLVGLRRGSLLVVVNVTGGDIDLAGIEALHGADLLIATELVEAAITIPADSTMWFALA
ncbi:MAG: alpha-amylase family glycosyl hydrolase, partial [Ilumatobacteraceae bacterium]